MHFATALGCSLRYPLRFICSNPVTWSEQVIDGVFR
jgi:hypothetical protein